MTQRLKIRAACKLFVFALVPALVLAALAFGSVAAQDNNDASFAFSPGPYRVGERLTYTVSYSNFISAGHIELLVAAHGTFFDRDGIQIKGHVETTGTVNAAVFAINNDYISYVDPATGLPFHTQQFIREASRTSDITADFNQPAGVAALEPKRTRGFPGNYDLLSLIYRIRALPLQDKSTYYLRLRTEGTDWEVEVKTSGREMIKTNVGSFDTIVSRIWIGAGSVSYGMKAHFSSDPMHVPVLVTARHSTGTIQVQLAASELIATPPLPPSPTPTPLATNPTPRPPIRPSQPETPAGDGVLAGLPFKVGEQLNYQVFLPNIQQSVASANFQVRARSRFFDRDGLFFSVVAQTTNAMQHLFSARDAMNSYTDPRALLPFQTEYDLKEGRRQVLAKLTINQDYGTATTDKGVRIEIPVGTHDYLSFFYALRTFNLNPPRRNAVSILVENKPKTLFITALKRESIQLGTQTVPAIQVSLTTDDAQSDKYQLRAWISDDARRLPLRLTAVTELGPMRADLAILPVTRQ